MGIQFTPAQAEELRSAWPVAGPLIKGTLQSFSEVFSNHPDEHFTGRSVAQIADLAMAEMEKVILGEKGDNGDQADNHGE